MAEKTRVPLAEAEALARQVVIMLGDDCHRIEVAGSIRRRRPDVGDVEIVCVPRLEPVAVGLFGDPGEPLNALDATCRDLLAEGSLEHRPDVNGRPAFGPRFKRLRYDGIALDLFSVLEPAQWGVILAIRTGPAEFSQRLVTTRSKGGFLPNWLKVRDGAIWSGDEPIATPEERDVFALLGLDWIPPERRTGRERAVIAS